MRLPRSAPSSNGLASCPAVTEGCRNVHLADARSLSVACDELVCTAHDGREWIDITVRLKEGDGANGLRIDNDGRRSAYLGRLRLNRAILAKRGTDVGTIDAQLATPIRMDQARRRAEIRL